MSMSRVSWNVNSDGTMDVRITKGKVVEHSRHFLNDSTNGVAKAVSTFAATNRLRDSVNA